LIGIFDSGIGGISVLNALVRQSPALHCLYVADAAFFPYGSKSREAVTERAVLVTELLLDRGCSLVVAACNSATGAAVAELRRASRVPIVGIEPAVKVARRYLGQGPIGVLCTDLTSSGEKYRRLMESQGLRARVVTCASPTLAAVVEAGELRGKSLRDYLRSEVEPFRRAGVGCLVLGCTHYAFVREEIEAILGVPVLEPSDAVARRALSLYPVGHMNGEAGRTVFATTGPLGKVRRRAEPLLERPAAEWLVAELPVSAAAAIP